MGEVATDVLTRKLAAAVPGCVPPQRVTFDDSAHMRGAPCIGGVVTGAHLELKADQPHPQTPGEICTCAFCYLTDMFGDMRRRLKAAQKSRLGLPAVRCAGAAARLRASCGATMRPPASPQRKRRARRY